MRRNEKEQEEMTRNEKKWRETEKNEIVTFVVMYHWHVNSFPVWSYAAISCHQVLALKNIAF